MGAGIIPHHIGPVVIVLCLISTLVYVSGTVKILPITIFYPVILTALISLIASWQASSLNIEGIVLGILYLLRPMVFLYAGYVVASRCNDRLILIAIMSTGTLESLIYIISYFNIPNVAEVNRYYIRTVIGTGSITTWLVPCCAALIWRTSRPLKRLSIAVLTAIATTALVMSTSRSGLIFIIIALLVYASTYRFRSFFAAGSVIIVAVSLALTTPLPVALFNINLSALLPDLLYELVAPSNSDVVGINEQWRGFEADRAFSFVFDQDLAQIWGTGLASTVPLGITIRLGGELYDAIGVFHSAFSLVFVRAGAAGLVMYLFQAYVLTRALGARFVGSVWVLGLTAWLFLLAGSSTIQGFFNAGTAGAVGMLLVGMALRRSTSAQT